MNSVSTSITMNHRRRRRFDHIRCFLLLLLASIATTTTKFQGNGVSMFALAQMQNNEVGRRHLLQRADVNEIATDAALQLQKAVEDTGEEKICEERTDETVYITRKNRRTKEKKKIELCEWVKKRPNARCKKFVKKRKRNKDPEIDKTFVKVCYNPKTYCEDVCADSVDVDVVVVEEDDVAEDLTSPVSDFPIKMSCPIEEADMTDMTAQIDGKTCAGFPIGHKCHYNKVNVGCTAKTFRCVPLVTCKCKEDSATGRDAWDCYSYLPPHDYYCPAEPRPKPADWEDPPEGLRQKCEMSDNEDATDEDSTIGIRREDRKSVV